MICYSCGHENDDTFAFCANCGAKLSHDEPVAKPAPVCSGDTEVLSYATEASAPVYTQPAEPQYEPPQTQYTPPAAPAQPVHQEAPAPKAPAAPVIPPEYKPLGAWAYFGWNLLFSIPLVGPILLLVFACGGCKNKNLRNYARSFFCGLLIAVIILVLFILVGAILGFSLAGLEGMV